MSTKKIRGSSFMRQESWNRFLETGSVADYLEYACTSEGSRGDKAGFNSGKEGELIDGAGKVNGDCADGSTFWGL